VATPSLYKHVGSLTDLRNLLAVRLIDEFTAATTAAVLGHSGAPALERLMRAYHHYAVTHPHRYALLPQAPDPDPTVAAAATRFIEVCYAVLAGCGLRDDEVVHATRITRAAMHGFAVLHASGGFGLPQDVDATLDRLVTLIVRGIVVAAR
jgi:AcrR family transcriptional regulator